MVNALRAVPPIAMVPFFLLWFGFSEWGKILLLTAGLGLNVFVAIADKLESPDRDATIMFKSFDIEPRTLVSQYWFQATLEGLLPTLRFGLAMAIGVALVAEMLGSQTGLGHVIQISRATFSMDVIFLAAAILGTITVAFDRLLIVFWRHLIYWKQ
ncbi:ABC transporter permease [Haloferula helveola]|uniref:ABC transporter permease n=2 Tax=Haloferula helveola TaxID=490095 RepID=A0ABN6H2R9_9BACT|nr:ABC transporter permease [Haloferula helveola]